MNHSKHAIIILILLLCFIPLYYNYFNKAHQDKVLSLTQQLETMKAQQDLQNQEIDTLLKQHEELTAEQEALQQRSLELHETIEDLLN